MSGLKKLLFLLLFLLSFFVRGEAQGDSCGLRFSLLTCAPGAELYSIFGHTALRVTDAAAGTDAVYNYGTFEFGPDFYVQFVRGKLPYALSVEDFNSFLYNYDAESRSVWEQELLLNCDQKAQLNAALQTNALPQNRTYRYDFLYDNCTTRAKDMIKRNAAQPIALTPILPKKIPTFRNLIHEKLDAGHLSWSKLGIDLLLGAKLDRKVPNEQAMFLPQNLLLGLEGATANGQPLVKKAAVILEKPSLLPKRNGFTPFIAFSLLLVAVIILSMLRPKGFQRTIAVFDVLFFAVTGIVGIVLLVMWFGTDHALCANNWNLAWALPTHLVVSPFLRSNKGWVNNYLLATIIIQSLLLIGWVFLPQELNTGFLPVVLLLLLRSWLIILKPHHGNPEPVV
ncbi:MAG: hypothetical protein JWP69_339 [Flaviaesturariibacter sp.]|nr:hypothetical protein [Flaviaesturariibacter sp.]